MSRENTGYFHYVSGDSLRVEMMRGAYKIVTQCAGVKPGETVVISTDTNKMKISEVLAGAVLSVGATPIIVMIPPTGAPGAPLPEPVNCAVEKADVFLMPATYSQTHTEARRRAIANGARGTTMMEIREDMLCTGGILADFEECDRFGHKLGDYMSKAHEFRFTTAAGTDLSGFIDGRPIQYETGLFRNPGEFAAVPNSEINFAPIEESINGRIVVDVRAMTIGVVKDEPFMITVKNGIVVNVEGSKAGIEFFENLKHFNDPTALMVAEFGLGLNPFSRMYSSNPEDLGKLGTGHVGIGTNAGIGGKIQAPCHIDVAFNETTVYLDGKKFYSKTGCLFK